MPGRSDTDADFARRHGRIDLFLPFDLFLLGFFSGLPRQALLRLVGGRGREKDQDHDNGAEEGDQYQAQITDMGAENVSFLFGFLAGRGLHQGVLSCQPDEAKAQLG